MIKLYHFILYYFPMDFILVLRHFDYPRSLQTLILVNHENQR